MLGETSGPNLSNGWAIWRSAFSASALRSRWNIKTAAVPGIWSTTAGRLAAGKEATSGPGGRRSTVQRRTVGRGMYSRDARRPQSRVAISVALSVPHAATLPAYACPRRQIAPTARVRPSRDSRCCCAAPAYAVACGTKPTRRRFAQDDRPWLAGPRCHEPRASRNVWKRPSPALGNLRLTGGPWLLTRVVCVCVCRADLDLPLLGCRWCAPSWSILKQAPPHERAGQAGLAPFPL